MNIALLTDFGTKDYFVGAMKGVIMSINSQAKITDITHEIKPQDIKAAGFTLRACYKDFPNKTVFVAVVDPGVGSDRRAILVETEDYFFIAPDNGLLSFVFNGSDSFRVYELTNKEFFKHPVSNTFHGRDIFAPSAAHLSTGISASAFGNEIRDFVITKDDKKRKINENLLEAEIIHSDHFGNLITNLTENDLPKAFSLVINEHKINKLQDFFSEAQKDEIFMIFGSTGFLEIVSFQNSAKKLLKVQIGDRITVKFEN